MAFVFVENRAAEPILPVRLFRSRVFSACSVLSFTAGGLYLLSRMDQHTSIWEETLFLLVLGAGIGLIMQILTLVVQNTVDYADLGTATSGVTFFRTLGGSFGASIMGSIFANGLTSRLPAALAAARVPPSAVTSPALLHKLPAAARDPVITAYARSRSARPSGRATWRPGSACRPGCCGRSTARS